MKMMINFVCAFIFFSVAGCAQHGASAVADIQTPQPRIGGSCEGCEAIYANKIPFEKMHWIDTLPDYNEAGPKLIVSGIIYKKDGKTPAKDVVLYIYHTDQTGRYTNKFNESGYAGKNGYCKGWIKTNEKGEYKFYTLMPGHYPNTNIPAHIHPIIKEPGINEYYIDEYLFKGDKFLTKEEIGRAENRCGSGIVTLRKENGILYATRNLVLGLNIPNYPSANKQ
jgi:protocatechuate 3,4-dioxygenase beta subunit